MLEQVGPSAAARGSVDLAVWSLTHGRVDRVEPLLSATRAALDRLSRLTGDLVEASRGTPTLGRGRVGSKRVTL